jgi:hypothetical protein
METGGERLPLLTRLREAALNVGAALLEGFARMDPAYFPPEPEPGSPEYIDQQVAAFRRSLRQL